MKIGNFDLNTKVLIIAEVGGNHNGDFDLAKRYIEEVAKTGADVVKFQMYRAEKLVTKDMPPHPLLKHKYKTQQERFKKLEFTREQWVELAGLAKEHGLSFMASAFDEETADFLDKISNVFKVASGDLTNLPLIRHVVKKNKPVLLSTGFATVEEIDRTVKEIPKNRLVLLHCVGSYPCSLEDANLLSIPFLKDRFGITVGYSDHTIGTLAPKIAVALGARVIEKHFTLDKTQPFGDHVLSVEPLEMKEIVDDIRKVEKMLGCRKGPVEAELKLIKSFRRSLAAKVDIPEKTAITEAMLMTLRPATGISPMEIDEIIGKRAKRYIKKGEIITRKDLIG